jgi:hypothetical protein
VTQAWEAFGTQNHILRSPCTARQLSNIPDCPQWRHNVVLGGSTRSYPPAFPCRTTARCPSICNSGPRHNYELPKITICCCTILLGHDDRQLRTTSAALSGVFRFNLSGMSPVRNGRMGTAPPPNIFWAFCRKLQALVILPSQSAKNSPSATSPRPLPRMAGRMACTISDE